jgi:hypothetical protein
MKAKYVLALLSISFGIGYMIHPAGSSVLDCRPNVIRSQFYDAATHNLNTNALLARIISDCPGFQAEWLDPARSHVAPEDGCPGNPWCAYRKK